MHHSGKNKITQYTVQKDDGGRFFETEEQLVALPRQTTANLGPLTGAWEGVMNGLPQGDFPFTMSLQQQDESVRGVLAVFFGGVAFKSSTLRNNTIELHWDTPLANFVFKGEYTAGKLSGQWFTDEGSKGTWEATKSVEDAKAQMK